MRQCNYDCKSFSITKLLKQYFHFTRIIFILFKTLLLKSDQRANAISSDRKCLSHFPSCLSHFYSSICNISKIFFIPNETILMQFPNVRSCPSLDHESLYVHCSSNMFFIRHETILMQFSNVHSCPSLDHESLYVRCSSYDARVLHV